MRDRKRLPRPATPERLERAGLAYLERFAATAEGLRRVLMRRVERSAYLHDTDPEAGRAAVEAIVARFAASGLVDDRAFAEGRAASLARRGESRRGIAMKLAQKGVPAPLVGAALDGLDSASDLALAIAYARRRRLGPWRLRDRDARRERDLAAMARAGHRLGIAQQVIDAADEAAVEALLAEEEG